MKAGRTKNLMLGGALVLASFGVGAAVAVTASASADTGSATASYGRPGAAQGEGQQADPSKPTRSDEKLLTGTTAEKVRAAALAKYPKATIERVETDSDGVYEAHVVTTSGEHVIVQVGKDFTVTGTQTGGTGGPGGPGGHGDHDGDGPGQGGTPPTAPPSA